jgi:hypothetical protein
VDVVMSLGIKAEFLNSVIDCLILLSVGLASSLLVNLSILLFTFLRLILPIFSWLASILSLSFY